MIDTIIDKYANTNPRQQTLALNQNVSLLLEVYVISLG